MAHYKVTPSRDWRARWFWGSRTQLAIEWLFLALSPALVLLPILYFCTMDRSSVFLWTDVHPACPRSWATVPASYLHRHASRHSSRRSQIMIDMEAYGGSTFNPFPSGKLEAAESKRRSLPFKTVLREDLHIEYLCNKTPSLLDNLWGALFHLINKNEYTRLAGLIATGLAHSKPFVPAVILACLSIDVLDSFIRRRYPVTCASDFSSTSNRPVWREIRSLSILWLYIWGLDS